MNLKALTIGAFSAIALSSCSSPNKITSLASDGSRVDLSKATIRLPAEKIGLKQFIKITEGKPYHYEAPFDVNGNQIYDRYDCVTLILAKLHLCHGHTFCRNGRTGDGSKILSDYLYAHSIATIGADHKIEVRAYRGEGSGPIDSRIRAGDIILIGNPDSTCENGVSVSHLTIALGSGKGIPMLHANSTQKYGLPSGVICDKLEDYLRHREGKHLYSQALICRVRDPLDRKWRTGSDKSELLADN